MRVVVGEGRAARILRTRQRLDGGAQRLNALRIGVVDAVLRNAATDRPLAVALAAKTPRGCLVGTDDRVVANADRDLAALQLTNRERWREIGRASCRERVCQSV